MGYNVKFSLNIQFEFPPVHSDGSPLLRPFPLGHGGGYHLDPPPPPPLLCGMVKPPRTKWRKEGRVVCNSRFGGGGGGGGSDGRCAGGAGGALPAGGRKCKKMKFANAKFVVERAGNDILD